MTCPQCGHSRSQVLRTDAPRRTRQCLSVSCGHRWTTVEVTGEQWTEARAVARSVLRKAHEALAELDERYI